jgi:hypothetical protein
MDEEHGKDESTKGVSIRDLPVETHVYEEALEETAETEDPLEDFIPGGD